MGEKNKHMQIINCCILNNQSVYIILRINVQIISGVKLVSTCTVSFVSSVLQKVTEITFVKCFMEYTSFCDPTAHSRS